MQFWWICTDSPCSFVTSCARRSKARAAASGFGRGACLGQIATFWQFLLTQLFLSPASVVVPVWDKLQHSDSFFWPNCFYIPLTFHQLRCHSKKLHIPCFLRSRAGKSVPTKQELKRFFFLTKNTLRLFVRDEKFSRTDSYSQSRQWKQLGFGSHKGGNRKSRNLLVDQGLDGWFRTGQDSGLMSSGDSNVNLRKGEKTIVESHGSTLSPPKIRLLLPSVRSPNS